MTESSTAALTDEAAREQLEAAQAELKKQLGKARKQFAYNLKLAQDRLTDAERELTGLRPKLEALEPFKNHPEGALSYANVALLTRIYAATRRMMEVQVACHQHNLAIVEGETIPERPEYRFPERELDHMEARAFSELYLATFHWLQHGDGIDLLLRASGQGAAARGQDELSERSRQVAAEKLADATRTDRTLAVLVGQMGAELKEAQELIEWATGALSRLEHLNPDEKRAALDVPQWAKLSGKVALMGTLPDRVRHVPVLAAMLPRYEAAVLPFEQVSWVAEDAAAGGGDRLTITGRLGAKR